MPHEKAFSLVLKSVSNVSVETVGLLNAAGRVLRKNIKADRALPPFNRSAMDGYAVKSSDFKNGRTSLVCMGVLKAGKEWKGKVTTGKCVKIMTGAPVPSGADAVVMVEKSNVAGTVTHLNDPGVKPWSNIHKKGADTNKGAALIVSGTLLVPGHMAVAASVGAAKISVSRMIKVAVVASGTELINVSKKPKPSQIRDSNSPFLISRLKGISWVKGIFMGIVRDEPRRFKAILKKAIRENDVVLITGGVSMGDADYTPIVLKELKVKNIFHKSSIKPGKPIWFGVTGKKAVFGLPGNPVSVAVTFSEFVKPALKKMAGISDPAPRKLLLPLSKDIRKKHDRKEFRIAAFTNGGGTVAAIKHQGSGDFVSASKSDGVIVIPSDRAEIKAGETVEFHPWEL